MTAMPRLLAPTLLSIVLLSGGAGCRRHESKPAAPSTSAANPSTPASPTAPQAGKRGKGNQQGGGMGMNRYRDTGVYVDGTPVGVLEWGELPIGLKPIWVNEEHDAEIEPGSHTSGVKLVPARRYRFTDYLKAIGVDLQRVKELHLMGPKATEITVVSGAELRSKKGEGFQFRFGGLVGGKAIPVIPADFGNRIHSDKIGSVMVYVHRKPPKVLGDKGMFLDGKPVDGIPYYGEPMKGGIRVYFDDRLVLQLKRSMWADLPAQPGPDGKPRYKLWSLLQAQGLDVSKIVEGWTIVDDRRKVRFSREQLTGITFEDGGKIAGSDRILLGDANVPASALALHSRALAPSDLPEIRPYEQD